MAETKELSLVGVSGIDKFFKTNTLQEKLQKQMTPKQVESFKTALLSLVNGNTNFEKVEAPSIINSALIAVSLDLSINQNLGYAYIIPYGTKAQFQIGYKGLIQLAIRSGQYKTISVAPVFEGQLLDNDPLKGMTFDWSKKATGTPIGYVAYLSLVNGFEKYFYMSKQQVESHGLKFSQTYKSEKKWIKDKSLWVTDFDSMAQKTVLKLLISKYGILSTQLEEATIKDQAIIENDNIIVYPDNPKESELVEKDTRSKLHVFIEDIAKTKEALLSIESQLSTPEEKQAYSVKMAKFEDEILYEEIDEEIGDDELLEAFNK